ncbi:MAG TPA: phosphotransferase [Mycobacteriales bacterium]|nr:phosphotransferase [Mycobacteriales bacterium]
MILAFEDVAGEEPVQPWDAGELRRVVAAIEALSAVPAPPGFPAAGDRPRLGGWAELAADPVRVGGLAVYSPWAAARLDRLLVLERDGLTAAAGSAVVHFDLYAHDILLTAGRVVFVDWPHARLGAPFVDLVITLSSAAAGGVDPEPLMREHQTGRGVDPLAVTAVLAAHAGFCVAGALTPPTPGLEPITAAKQHLGHGALAWLEQRLTHT